MVLNRVHFSVYSGFKETRLKSLKESILATFNIICSWHFIGDWHSFLVQSPSWHSFVSPLLQTNKRLSFLKAYKIQINNQKRSLALDMHKIDQPHMTLKKTGTVLFQIMSLRKIRSWLIVNTSVKKKEICTDLYRLLHTCTNLLILAWHFHSAFD